VVLQETDLGIQYGGTREALAAAFRKSAQKLVDAILADYEARAKESGDKKRYNLLGIRAAEFGRYLLAESAFNTALGIDRNYLLPQVNLGNVLYLKQDYQNALRVLHGVESTLKGQAKPDQRLSAQVCLSLSKCYYELESYDRASQYYDRVNEIDPELLEPYKYLRTSGEGTRASSVVGTPSIQFAREGD
jgi:tetratricopeptide (TPR) repeat protein